MADFTGGKAFRESDARQQKVVCRQESDKWRQATCIKRHSFGELSFDLCPGAFLKWHFVSVHQYYGRFNEGSVHVAPADSA